MSDPIYIPDLSPDRLCFRDERFVTRIGIDKLGDPTDDIPDYWFSLGSLWKIRQELEELLTDDAPEWTEKLLREYNWSNTTRHKTKGSVAWAPTSEYGIIQAPYTLTLTRAIEELDSPYFYSPFLQGWVFDLNKYDLEHLQNIVQTYGIQPSPYLSNVFDGRGNWEERLASAVQHAEDIGIKPIESFESGREYRWWQKQAVSALNQLPLLADQVGLGKGGEFIGGALALDKWMKDRHNLEHDETVYPVVLSTKKSLKSEIAEEIHTWKHDATIQIISGTKSEPLEPGMDFYVLNHDILNPRLDDILEVQPRSFIADEAHAFKNPGAKRSQAAQKLALDIRERIEHPEGISAYIVMATGTPFDNTPSELWSLLEIHGVEEIFGEYAKEKLGKEQMIVKFWNHKLRRVITQRKTMTGHRAFEEYFCRGVYYGHRWVTQGAAHTAELNALLTEHLIIRRKKSDVIDPLPEIYETITTVEMDDHYKEEYRRQDEEFAKWAQSQIETIMEVEGTSRSKALQILKMKLKNAEQVMQMTQLRRTLSHGKVEPTVEWIHRFMAGDSDIVGNDADKRRKLILFVHHIEPRNEFVNHPELQQYGVRHILSGAEQDGDSIQQHKRDFQEDPDVRLLICSMAAREGHTLTAAYDIAMTDIPFTASWVMQIAGRCWARLPDVHEAYLHYIVVPGTEDSRSIRRIRLKSMTFNAVIDGEGSDENLEEAMEEDVDLLMEDVAQKIRKLGIVG